MTARQLSVADVQLAARMVVFARARAAVTRSIFWHTEARAWETIVIREAKHVMHLTERAQRPAIAA
jgi:hypothetical protein